MGVLSRFFPPRASQSAIVSRQVGNIHQAQIQQLGDREQAAQAVMDGVLDWLVVELAAEQNPSAAAREICRELLTRVADHRRATGGGNAA